MTNVIGKTLYESLIENKWVDISYVQGSQITYFWIAITGFKDKDTICCKMVNYRLNNKSIDATIKIKNIIGARLIIGSYYKYDEKLIETIKNNPEDFPWCATEEFNENILNYLVECNEFDNDPYVSEAFSLPGFSYEELKNPDHVLSEHSFNLFLHLVFKANEDDAREKMKHAEIGLSNLSISLNGKKYVIAYQTLSVDFDSRKVKLSEKSRINKSFLIDGKKCNIHNYINCSADDFINEYDSNRYIYKEVIRENLNSKEIIDTREEIFIVKRDFVCDLDKVSDGIKEMVRQDSLTKPLSAFFGKNISRRKAKNKEPYIVIRDKKANIDQIRVVYNSMTNFITYVEGPPGTGKTKTIINVILSAMANNQTCLVCSNNNKPIDDIYNSINFTHTNGEKVLFPIIRIGNNDVNKEALKILRDFYSKIDLIKEKKINESLTETSKDKGLSIFSDLKKALDDYEKKQELEDDARIIKNTMEIAESDHFKHDLLNQLANKNMQITNLKHITDDYVKNLVIPADEIVNYQNYLYYKSLCFIKKLGEKSNNDLVEIILINDEDEALKQFNKYLSNDVNIKKFISIFPVVLTTNIAAGKLGSARPHFDICIMDEAGQCNIATSLVPIVRAKSLLLVGDINQLKPVIVLEETLNTKLMDKYGISSEYNYLNNSILSLMKNKDKTSKFIRLRYHYRCPKKIIEFCNKYFYEDSLIIENNEIANFKFYDVENKKIPTLSNAFEEEANTVVDIIQKNKYKDVTIITAFKNQAELINRKLRERKIENIKAGTIHTVQGAEKDTIIFSAALCHQSNPKTFDWIKNNQQLINVGISRAKRDFIVVGDYEAINAHDKKENSIIKKLVDYVHSNGDITKIEQTHVHRTNFSNESTAEKELYETLKPFFRMNNKLLLEANKKVNETLKEPNKEYLKYYHKAEFDLVISQKNFFGKVIPLLIIELDGGEHIVCEKHYKNDRKKEFICKGEKIPLIRVPNFLSKDYDYLITLLAKKLHVRKPKTPFDDIR